MYFFTFDLIIRYLKLTGKLSILNNLKLWEKTNHFVIHYCIHKIIRKKLFFSVKDPSCCFINHFINNDIIPVVFFNHILKQLYMQLVKFCVIESEFQKQQFELTPYVFSSPQMKVPFSLSSSDENFGPKPPKQYNLQHKYKIRSNLENVFQSKGYTNCHLLIGTIRYWCQTIFLCNSDQENMALLLILQITIRTG